MRLVLSLAVLLAVGCRAERGAGPSPRSGPRAKGAAASPAEPAAISDADLVAFVRWQRDFNEIMSRQKAEIDALQPDPSKPFDEAVKEVGQQTVAVTERFGPEVRALYGRLPLEGKRLELATEAVGGLYHWKYTLAGPQLVVAWDEERIGAARRKYGEKAVDAILAREALIMAELQRP
jgi:hypothetical protein